MAEKPILFSGAMVRAILAGHKTQTRRVMNPQPSAEFSPLAVEWYEPVRVDRNGDEYPGSAIYGAYDEEEGYRSPYGAPGDCLWVRETFRCVSVGKYGVSSVEYKADGKIVEIENTREAADLWFEAYKNDEKWRPSIFMPRWACRIMLEVVNVRVERLQDITCHDVAKEGCPPEHHMNQNSGMTDAMFGWWEHLWKNINGEESWNNNPWLWVIEFKVV